MSGSSVVNNIFTSLGIKNKGIGGLASGLDTDSLMEAMTMTTRSKIAQQQQQRQLANWKMTAYRATASTLSAFKYNYFDYSKVSSQNMLSSGFYNTFKASSSSDKISVTSTTSSSPVDFSISKVHQLATSQNVTSGQTLSPAMTGTEVQLVDASNNATNFTGKVLTLTVDGATKTIKLDKLQAVADYAAANPGAADLDQKLQDALTEIMDDNFAFTQNRQVTLPDNTTAAFNTLNESDYTAAEWEAIEEQVRTVNVDVTGGKISLTSEYSKVTVTGSTTAAQETNALLGLTAGLSNRVDTGTTLRDLFGFGSNLAGNTFKFKINGAEFTINADESLSTLISRVNSSTANVRMAYSSATDSLTLTSKVTGAGQNLQIEDVYGNLMGQVFGTPSSDDLAAKHLTKDGGLSAVNNYDSMTTEEKLAFINNFNGRSFNMTIGSNTKAVTMRVSNVDGLSDKIDAGTPPTMNELVAMLNAGLDTAFGQSETLRQGVIFEAGSTGLKITSTNPDAAYWIDNNKASTTRDFVSALGFVDGNRTNTVDFSQTGYETMLANSVGIADGTYTIMVNDTDAISINVDGTTTLDDIITSLDAYGIKLSVKDILDQPADAKNRKTDYRLVLETGGNKVADDGADGLLGKLFGVSEYQSAGESADFSSRMKMGQNAEIEVDGQTLSFESNSFDLNGAQITLNDVSTEPINVKVEANPDELIDKIKSFIDDYNIMVEALNTMIYEEAKSGYTPLSDEQKADMSADEIEKWEAEAKKGILRSDSTLRGIVDQMRNVFYEKIDTIGLAGYDLGITTKSILDGKMTDNGKIELTDAGIEKLRKAVDQNPDAVREVFTNADNGIAVRLNDILDKATNSSSLPEKRGSLVRIAGTTSLTADNTSNLGRQIDSIDQKLTTLKARLETEYDRYWRKFSALEVAISKLNSQGNMFQ